MRCVSGLQCEEIMFLMRDIQVGRGCGVYKGRGIFVFVVRVMDRSNDSQWWL